MPGTRRGTFWVFVLSLLPLGLCGCDEKMPMWTGLGTPPTVIPGIVSPVDRQIALQELAKKAPTTTDPGQREAICRDLAQQIRPERDSLIRGEILKTLAAYGGPTSADVMHKAVQDPDADVRKLVCDLWGRRSDAESAAVLAYLLSHDSDKDVRMAAARGLEHSHEQIAKEALSAALGDKDPAMQYCAMVSLHGVTGQDFGNDVDKWRQYMKTGKVPDDRSWADRTFFWWRWRLSTSNELAFTSVKTASSPASRASMAEFARETRRIAWQFSGAAADENIRLGVTLFALRMGTSALG